MSVSTRRRLVGSSTFKDDTSKHHNIPHELPNNHQRPCKREATRKNNRWSPLPCFDIKRISEGAKSDIGMPGSHSISSDHKPVKSDSQLPGLFRRSRTVSLSNGQSTKSRLFSPVTMLLLLLTMASLCVLQPVSAAPTDSQEPIPSLMGKDLAISQKLSRDQHPRWNTECLTEQEQLQRRGLDDSATEQMHKRGLEKSQAGVEVWTDVPSLAVVNSTNITCNGRADLCDLRYDQVTYPATHNSASYSLQYDCSTSTQSCLDTKTVCNAQAQNCTMGWEVQCTKISNTCLDRMPTWLHWLCGAFTSACEATEQVCLGWEDICTSSLEVCTLWGSACLGAIPDWAITCLWENQPNHTITQQLTDGIRFLDLGTCLTNNNTEIVMCHGNGVTRAIGITLDSVLTEIVQFIKANPYEVLTIEFNEYDGNSTILAAMIVQKVQQYFIPTTGQSLLYTLSSLGQTWPTLQDMIVANQRIFIFMSDIYGAISDPKPGWANQKDTWRQDGFPYTSQDTKPSQLNQSYYDWCTQGPGNGSSYILWQQIDINLSILESDIVQSIKQGQVPELCIGPLAVETNFAMLDALASYCYTRWPYWFRVRVNYYWQSDLFKIVNQFNDMNVARVKAGNSITPY